jgi:hypothetical protein
LKDESIGFARRENVSIEESWRITIRFGKPGSAGRRLRMRVLLVESLAILIVRMA